MPLGVWPLHYNSQEKMFEMGPVEAMTQMVPEVPFVGNMDGDKKQFLTLACLLTMSTIQSLYPTDYALILPYFNEVQALTWGNHNHSPFFVIDGKKSNLRSGAPKEKSYDGSSSHGLTVEEVGNNAAGQT
uniref:Uncharacterized protein n=1 Tax=Moniliophthora roreri TaxID=221103 RepID=A0A0W0FUQ1_MONRR